MGGAPIQLEVFIKNSIARAEEIDIAYAKAEDKDKDEVLSLARSRWFYAKEVGGGELLGIIGMFLQEMADAGLNGYEFFRDPDFKAKDLAGRKAAISLWLKLFMTSGVLGAPGRNLNDRLERIIDKNEGGFNTFKNTYIKRPKGETKVKKVENLDKLF